MNPILSKIQSHFASSRQTPSGWRTLNCPCCVAAGEARPDTRERGGILYTPEGGFVYKCFNCKTKAGWAPGSMFSHKAKFLFECLGLSKQEINQLNFAAWQLRGQASQYQKQPVVFDPNFNEISLEPTTKSFTEIAQQETPNSNAVAAVNYVYERLPFLIDKREFYWSPSRKKDMHKRVIIPDYWNGKLVGYTARRIDDKRLERYSDNFPEHYIFNNQAMYKDRKYLFLVEGIFDALSIDAAAIMGSTVSEQQAYWINSMHKQVVVIPDRNKASRTMVDAAIEYGWSVAFPYWENEIEDVNNAITEYGRLYTVKSIVDSIETSKVAINVRSKKFLNL